MNLSDTHRVATPGDLPRILELLGEHSQQVVVRDLFYLKTFLLTDIAEGPYAVEVCGEASVLTGFAHGGHIAKLRIMPDSTVEIIDRRRPTWTAPSLGSIRIFIPK